MKKLNITIVFCMLLSFLSKAQISLAKEDGTAINDGGIITYNTTNENPANLHYKIKNNSSSPIGVRIKVMNITNADGSAFQFCYLNVCLPFVSTGAVYPANSKPAISIPGNSEVSAGYTMWNSDTGSGTFPIDYVLKYYMVDDFNNEYGTPVTFTYRYNPNAVLKVDDVNKRQNSFAEISATMIRNTIEVTSKVDLSYELYNMEGRILLKGILKKGKELIDTSVLRNGVYMIILKNHQGEMVSKKIIKNY